MTSVIVRVFRIFVFAITITLVLLAVRCTQVEEYQAEQGRKWCEGVIAIFESDQRAFLARHAKQVHHGLLVVRPSSPPGPTAADFVVKQSGEFVCRYWHGDALSPQGSKYTSERRRWVPVR